MNSSASSSLDEFLELPHSRKEWASTPKSSTFSLPLPTRVEVTLKPQSDPSSTGLHLIVFQNYYTSSIMVGQPDGPASSFSYSTLTTILEKKLMENTYTEDGAQSWFTINVSEFSSNYAAAKPLVFTLIQPTKLWSRYDIQGIKLYAKNPAAVRAQEKPETTATSTTTMQNSISELLIEDFKILSHAVKVLVSVPFLYSAFCFELCTSLLFLDSVRLTSLLFLSLLADSILFAKY
jgi:hypothetical protein